jgi:gamma-glutamylputrescine oxidase
MSVSFWQRSPHSSTIQTDVVVIGAGIAGISAALHLQRRGKRVTMIDAGHIGAGASTRNAGFLMRGCADNYTSAIAQFGRPRAQALWKLTEDNLTGLLREGVGALPGTRRVPSVLVALEAREEAQLQASAKLLHEDGFDASLLHAQSLREADQGFDSLWRGGHVRAALVNPNDAACHSREVIEHLASRFVGQIITHDEVFSIENDAASVLVRSRKHLLRAQHVLLCTNAYGPRLVPSLSGKVQPNRGQMFACRPANVSLAASYYLNEGHEYIRQTADGTILVGGCRAMFESDERTTLEEPTVQVQAALEAFVRRVLALPASEPLNITARWAGLMGFSQTGLPIIQHVGTLENPAAPVWFCGGFTGHGMSMAYETTRLAVDEMLDGKASIFSQLP